MQLLPHPDCRASPVRRLDATTAYGPDGALRLTWHLVADLRQLRIPPATAPARVDELWRHTCFEAFVADPHSSGYLELNFSPSGQWAAYGFRSYRTGMAPLPLRQDPTAHWEQNDDGLSLTVNFRMDDLPGPPGPRPPIPLRVGLAAVVEDEAGTLSHWALRHGPGKPDFHHAEAFALPVTPVAAPS